MTYLTQRNRGVKRGRDNPLRAKTRFWVIWVNIKQVAQTTQVARGLWVNWVDREPVTQMAQVASRSAGQPVSRSAGQPVSPPAPALGLRRFAGALLLPAPAPTPGGGPTRTGHFYAAPRKNFLFFAKTQEIPYA